MELLAVLLLGATLVALVLFISRLGRTVVNAVVDFVTDYVDTVDELLGDTGLDNEVLFRILVTLPLTLAVAVAFAVLVAFFYHGPLIAAGFVLFVVLGLAIAISADPEKTGDDGPKMPLNL